jgi:uncharacterized RDD family membrane protein YckC
MLTRAGFWPRLAATAIDYAIILVGCALLGATAGGLLPVRGSDDDVWVAPLAGDPVLGALAGVIAGFTLVGAVYMSLEIWVGTTAGKRILRLAIVTDAGAAAPLSVRVSRYLVKNCHLIFGAGATLTGLWFISALAPLATLVVVAGSTMMLTDEHRALHDVVAGTAVVATTTASAAPPPVPTV